MERRLTRYAWLVADRPTVADLALFAYTHRADEGSLELAHWPGVAAWIARMMSVSDIAVLPRPDHWVDDATGGVASELPA